MGYPKDTQDLVEKEFIAFPDIMADMLNVLLYHGKNIVKKENLLAGPTEVIYLGGRRLRTQYEDFCMYDMAGGEVRIMYMVANQSKTDGKMLLRKAGYTGGAYRGQYAGKVRDVFPVIEVVLYWGNPRWKSSRNLHRLFRKRKLLKDEWEFVDELRLHVYEMRHLPENVRKLFKSDMRIIVDFFAEGKEYRSDRKIVHKAALIKMIKVLSGDMDIEGVEGWLEKQGIREEDEVMVCELFDQYERKGREEGREEGENRLARLMQALISSGRNDDLEKAVFDQDYRKQLYAEVNLA